MTMMLNRPVEAVDETVAGLLPGMPTPAEFLALDFVGRRNVVMDFIQANPELHDQRTWGEAKATAVKDNGYAVDVAACGTTACLAGWTTLFAGARPKLRPARIEEYLTVDAEVDDPPSTITVAWETVAAPGGDHVRVSDYARDLLGLSPEQGDHMFWGHNTREELAAMITRINAGRELHHGCGCYDEA